MHRFLLLGHLKEKSLKITLFHLKLSYFVHKIKRVITYFYLELLKILHDKYKLILNLFDLLAQLFETIIIIFSLFLLLQFI